MKQILNSDKVKIITRRDLSPGYQLIQSAHSIADFCIQHPKIAAEWHKNSNSLVAVSVPDLKSLEQLIPQFQELGVAYTAFYEPDVGDELTAICVEPDIRVSKLLCSLPLALKEYKSSPNTLDKNNYVNQLKTLTL